MLMITWFLNAIENLTHHKQTTTSTDFEIHPDMKLTLSLKDLLSTSRSKGHLPSMLAKALLDYFSNGIPFKMVVLYNNKIRGPDLDEKCAHDKLIC